MAKTKTKPTKEKKKSKTRKAEIEAKVTAMTRKQTELARVFQLKCDLLMQNSCISYLEYIELRDEICRLNVLKEVFASEAAKVLGK